ncbi:unnamed protein product [Mycena citricolor]|uniref:Uncharacterized protein n=1 Tax=Mycena citricolor TaxID=2018698 RepID=A0AAD2HYT3_9AGAR|nr:unnamed protein product [Mycena citricolor]
MPRKAQMTMQMEKHNWERQSASAPTLQPHIKRTRCLATWNERDPSRPGAEYTLRKIGVAQHRLQRRQVR